MLERFEVAVVGGGIVGLAHAWAAARRGRSVVLFERHPQAIGASIRNFGMIWNIGQPLGEVHDIAMRSRELWLELARDAGLWLNPCGSLHLAYRDDELRVLAEFHELARGRGVEVRMLTKAEVLERTSAANQSGLLGGLSSDLEMCVNPREAIRRIPQWLQERFGVELNFSTSITRVEHPQLWSADGRSWLADQIVICSGHDFATLFPAEFSSRDLHTCKLQMLRTVAQPAGWRIGPLLAGGLSLQHYASFGDCPSMSDLKRRIAEESPELNQFGIHVLASQNDHGEVLLGDSHEYDDAITPFDRNEIEQLILRELRRMIQLPNWTIAERWHGLYAKHATDPVFRIEPQPGVQVITATSGSGMTLAFGLAESQGIH